MPTNCGTREKEDPTRTWATPRRANDRQTTPGRERFKALEGELREPKEGQRDPEGASRLEARDGLAMRVAAGRRDDVRPSRRQA
jgi:hypothetical protein